MKKIITIITIVATLITGIVLAVDPIIFTPAPSPMGQNNYIAILTPEQVVALWSGMRPTMDLPFIATNNHIQCFSLILMPDGSAKANTIWMSDPVIPIDTNTVMVAKPKVKKVTFGK